MAGKQILVVEDETIVAEHIRRSLQNMGYSIPITVSTGEKAIKETEDNHPDLVLMDIVLGGKMDGIEAAMQIRSRFDIPVVYLTAYSDEKILERARITEPFGYVIKPFDERELKINIEIALYKHKMESALREREQWLNATLNSLGEAVIATDEKGIIRVINPFAEALTGYTQKEALGKPLLGIFKVMSEGTDKQIEDPVAKAIRDGNFYGLADNTLLITKEGLKIPVDIIGSIIKNDRNGINGVVLIFYDIVERRKINGTLRS